MIGPMILHIVALLQTFCGCVGRAEEAHVSLGVVVIWWQQTQTLSVARKWDLCAHSWFSEDIVWLIPLLPNSCSPVSWQIQMGCFWIHQHCLAYPAPPCKRQCHAITGETDIYPTRQIIYRSFNISDYCSNNGCHLFYSAKAPAQKLLGNAKLAKCWC